MDTTQDVIMNDETTQDITTNGVHDQSVNGQDLTDPLPDPQNTINTQSAPAHPIAAADTPATLQTAVSSLAAASVRPGSQPPQQAAVRPEKPVPHGGPTRQYLNQHVTPHLLEGMKYLAMHEPEKPLEWLADFLKNRSKQIEGS